MAGFFLQAAVLSPNPAKHSAMTYHLLTGATGLLGSYLLRDGLREGHRLAVLVRPTKRESARQRVESILARFEHECRMTLPRPFVIEGELTEVDLGLDGGDLHWISRHCRSVIHNAASLTFHSNGRRGRTVAEQRRGHAADPRSLPHYRDPSIPLRFHGIRCRAARGESVGDGVGRRSNAGQRLRAQQDRGRKLVRARPGSIRPPSIVPRLSWAIPGRAIRRLFMVSTRW